MALPDARVEIGSDIGVDQIRLRLPGRRQNFDHIDFPQSA